MQLLVKVWPTSAVGLTSLRLVGLNAPSPPPPPPIQEDQDLLLRRELPRQRIVEISLEESL